MFLAGKSKRVRSQEVDAMDKFSIKKAVSDAVCFKELAPMRI